MKSFNGSLSNAESTFSRIISRIIEGIENKDPSAINTYRMLPLEDQVLISAVLKNTGSSVEIPPPTKFNGVFLSPLENQGNRNNGASSATSNDQGNEKSSRDESGGNLRLNTKNTTEVSALQERLLAEFPGLNIPVDGKYGPETKAAVMRWQKENGLTPDGIVGPKTLAAFKENTLQDQGQQGSGHSGGGNDDITTGAHYSSASQRAGAWLRGLHTAAPVPTRPEAAEAAREKGREARRGSALSDVTGGSNSSTSTAPTPAAPSGLAAAYAAAKGVGSTLQSAGVTGGSNNGTQPTAPPETPRTPQTPELAGGIGR